MQGALIATSGEITSLFLAPPLISEDEDLRRIADALHHGLQVADDELERTSGGAAAS
jgi:adenosylmethionine-8-amino-7-oxononanoate aminotransferase